MQRIEIRPDYTISKVIKGGWHLAGGHGKIDEIRALEDMREFVKAGITTFDCADIYTGVEQLIGKFRQKYQDEFRAGDLPPIQIHTKYVPDYAALANLKKKDTEKIIDRSLKRLNVERLDLVQFAWWDYQFPGYVDTALHLSELQKSGKIRHIGLSNDSAWGINQFINLSEKYNLPRIQSLQNEYNLLRRRDETDIMEICSLEKISYLTWSPLNMGVLSGKYLNNKRPVLSRMSDKFLSNDSLKDILAYRLNVKDEVIIEYIISQLLENQEGNVWVGSTYNSKLKKIDEENAFIRPIPELHSVAEVVSHLTTWQKETILKIKMWNLHPEINPYHLGSYGFLIWRKDFLNFRDNFELIGNIEIIDNAPEIIDKMRK